MPDSLIEMKGFYIITALAAGLLILIICLPDLDALRLPLLIILVLIYAMILVYGAATLSSQLFLPASCRGDSGSRKLAITFDDGPHVRRSGEILELLRKYDCKASFFLIGSRAEQSPGIVDQMIKEGHLVGNHSYSHSSFFPLYRRSRIRKELELTNSILEKAGSGPIRYFRPPFGVSNPNVAGGLKGSGMEVAGWSIRSFDTRNQAPEKVVSKILKRMGGGEVILLHETSDHILEILEQLLPSIKEAGLECARLDEIFI